MLSNIENYFSSPFSHLQFHALIPRSHWNCPASLGTCHYFHLNRNAEWCRLVYWLHSTIERFPPELFRIIIIQTSSLKHFHFFEIATICLCVTAQKLDWTFIYIVSQMFKYSDCFVFFLSHSLIQEWETKLEGCHSLATSSEWQPTNFVCHSLARCFLLFVANPDVAWPQLKVQQPTLMLTVVNDNLSSCHPHFAIFELLC